MQRRFNIHGFNFIVWGYGWAHRPDDGRTALVLCENYLRIEIGGNAQDLWNDLRGWDAGSKCYPPKATTAIQTTLSAYTDAYRSGIEPGTLWIGAVA